MTSISSIGSISSNALASSSELQERQGVDRNISKKSAAGLSDQKPVMADRQDLSDALQAANQRLAASGSELELSFNSESGVVTMRVVSKQTGEVLLQVPAQNGVIDTGALLSGLGLFVNESP
jgi:uncharacterized FlaG/YvyC family protein